LVGVTVLVWPCFCAAGGIGAPRTKNACQAASLKLDFAVEEAQKLQVRHDLILPYEPSSVELLQLMKGRSGVALTQFSSSRYSVTMTHTEYVRGRTLCMFV
jgi:hypothetical protein